jgi:RibD C-terminal domain
MAKLIYSAIASLDGYIEDEQGEFGWATPDEEVHAAINDLERPISTYLYGRRLYETMVFWDCTCTRSWSAAESAPCPTTFMSGSSSSPSAASEAASCTSATRFAPDCLTGDWSSRDDAYRGLSRATYVELRCEDDPAA